MNISEDALQEIITAVCSSSRYKNIHPALVRQISLQEIAKVRNQKEAVKSIRSKLHQIGGAYFDKPVDYASLYTSLKKAPSTLDDPDLKAFCLQAMRSHASTRERLPILSEFYTTILKDIAPLSSILDLACGHNPLTLPWMPVAADCQYFACDIYADMINFINIFFTHVGVQGTADLCNLVEGTPATPVQLALLLKTLPCLEQVDKSASLRLLEQISAQHILVSYPASSLGGRGKGMLKNYENHFRELIAEKNWIVQRFEFSTELAFLVHKES